MIRPKFVSWLLQAESDLRSVRILIEGQQYSQACFAAQQSAEKALKALAFFRGADIVKSHSLSTILEDLGINGELQSYSNKLDIYYITSRYPDALPDHGVPAEKFDNVMAREALKMAEVFLKNVKSELKV